MRKTALLLIMMLFPLYHTVQARQFLPVKGIVNARDLGGYAAADGRTVRTGLLIRTAALSEATAADISYLQGIPVRQVIDFRMDMELEGRSDPVIPGAVNIRIPINSNGDIKDDPDAQKIRKRRKFDVRKIMMIVAFNKKAQALARDLYPNMVNTPSCQEQFAAFLRRVVEAPADGAVLFHCTQGKDRTGLASAYLLAALGVDRKTIIDDFDATNAVYEADVRKYTRRVRFWGGKEEEIGVVKAFLGANTDNFVKTLDMIDARYGSLEAYLKGPLGLTDADISVLRSKYLE